jgi:5-methyltetrahydropteroyltriglutamate--homocysteine methyltransferase
VIASRCARPVGALDEKKRITMPVRVLAYQHGIYPRSEGVVSATRGLERGRTSADEVSSAYRDDEREFVGVQRDAGLDLFSDGLLRWQDIFRPLVKLSGGLDARTLVRWFNNNSFYRAPEITGDLTISAPLPREMEEDGEIPGPKVATLPSPYLFSRAAHSDDDRNAVMMDLAREVLGPVAQALPAHGYQVIHFQEPWLAYFGIEKDDWDPFEKALQEIVQATKGATVVLHAYFGDAGPYADRLRHLPVDAVGIDFVETDLDELGTNWGTGVLAGVLDGRASPVESVEGTAAFARKIADTLDPAILYLSSNCDLELLPRDLAARKVQRLGEVSARVKEDLA